MPPFPFSAQIVQVLIFIKQVSRYNFAQYHVYCLSHLYVVEALIRHMHFQVHFLYALF